MPMRRLGVLAVLVALVHSLRFSGCSVDDAYISFRYALNLAEGRGLVYNAGERVEGYTNFLWTLLAAVFHRAGAPAPLWMPLVSLAALLALVWVTVQAARSLDPDDPSPGGGVAGLVVALSAGLAYHAFAGLETVAFTLAWTVAAVAAVQSRPARFALAAAVAFLLRPEAGLLALWGLAALAAAPAAPPTPAAPSARRAVLLAGALLAALLAPYLLWKYWYFHSLLPNTLGAKSPDRAAGLRYLGVWLGSAGGLLAMSASGLRSMRRPDRWLLGLVALHSLAVVLEGGDWMFGARLLLPSLPCLAIVFEGRVRPQLARPGAWRLAAFAAALLWAGQNLREGARISHANELTAPQDLAHSAIARELLGRGARSVALHDIGVFGYAVPAMTIHDLGGLTDPVLARYPGGMGRKRIDDAWLALRAPDLVLLNAFPVGAPGDPRPTIRVQWPVERRLMALRAFRERYVPECVASVAGYHLLLAYRRRDRALAPAARDPNCTTMDEALRHAGRWSSSLAAAFSPD